MLLFNPNLARVQLELGALYFRMGSYELSRTYFDKALAGNPPPEVKSRIETYLAEIYAAERAAAVQRVPRSSGGSTSPTPISRRARRWCIRRSATCC